MELDTFLNNKSLKNKKTIKLNFIEVQTFYNTIC